MAKTATGVLDAPEKKAPARTKAPARNTTNRRGTRNKEAVIAKPRSSRNKEIAKRGEDAAARYLTRRGYEILERNWECFAGEADIIARDEDVLVFVEVKTRRDPSRGFPREAVTRDKRQRYEKIACAYMTEHEFPDILIRFDVIAMVVIDEERFIVRHHLNAFSAGECA